MHGMTWKHNVYGFRVFQEDAAEMARLATGRPFVIGDKYEIHGIPTDWQEPSVFEALSQLDQPWSQIK